MKIKTQKELEDYFLILEVDFEFDEILSSLDDEEFLEKIPFHESVTIAEKKDWLSNVYGRLRQGLIGS